MEGKTPVVQKKWPMDPERNVVVNKEVAELVKAGVLRETKFPTGVSNPVMVKKGAATFWMCVDFKYLNRACPKGNYLLLEIDQKVESLVGFIWKSFLDAYK